MHQCIKYWFMASVLIMSVLVSIAHHKVYAVFSNVAINTDQSLSYSKTVSGDTKSKSVLVYGSALFKTMLILQLSSHVKIFSNTWLQDKDFNSQQIAEQYSQTLSDDFHIVPININREKLLSYGIDFIVGSWHYGGFGNYVWMIPEYLHRLNIGSYVSGKNICAKLQNRFWCDLFYLGEIFAVSNRASEIINYYKEQEKQIVNSVSDDLILPRVLIFRGKFKQGSSYIAGINNFLAHILLKHNWQVIHPKAVFNRDWVIIKDEFILQQNPDLIIIVGDSRQELLQQLRDNQILHLLSAVKQKRVVWLTYDEVTASPDYLKGLNKIYQALKFI